MEKKIKVPHPLLNQDYPDMDVIRVDDTYYMISTTMYFMPGAVILRSYNMVDWEILTYVYETLDDTPAQKLEGSQEIYGQGMWAATLRYHKGTFYVCFVANDTGKTYLYQTDNIEGSWKKKTIEGFYHDCSLLFDDDDRVYIVYGNRTIYLTELDAELNGPKEGGLHRVIVVDSDNPNLGYEGAHLHKINGKYYVILIRSLPDRWYRVESCFMADSLEGEFRGGDIFEDDMGYRDAGIAQGAIVDTPDGDWYAMLFQDRGGSGRIPYLFPMHWENDFPVIGDNGKAVEHFEVKDYRPDHEYAPLYVSDDFRYTPDENGKITLKKPWQWNHNPDNALWSVTERPGAYRIRTGKLCEDVTHAVNSLTQRTAEPSSEAEVTIDASAMKDGDYAGIAALIGCYGAAAVTRQDGKYAVVMIEKETGTGAITEEYGKDKPEIERERIELDAPIIRLMCRVDYTDETDIATFYWLKDDEWKQIGPEKPLMFKLDHFTGTRFALFNYATKETGGYADFMEFTYRVE